ncbi:tyrosine-type recombinase/integrase [Prauserella alba]|uniref:Tyr recombinase domain-containing protein n=1 Tax=Prauserella alba TaxID=176898 RepID=A0ABP4G2A0_9PSEU|nr:tyrosine-type recombinase/integrase [Prauserella alba]MCP2183556.1 Site-specific recombinase XerD [Prauserella alba]
MGHIQDRWYRPKEDPDTGEVVLNKRGKPVMEKTERYGTGMRYKARYFDPDGKERSKSFPDRARKKAEDFLLEVEGEVKAGDYVDPNAGKVLFTDFGKVWLAGQTMEASSRESTESRLRSVIEPYFGNMVLSAIKPTDVRGWIRSMQEAGRSAGHQAVCFAHLSAILTAAVDDNLIKTNPCHAKSVKRPKSDEHKVVPWSRETVRKVRDGIPPRYRILVPVGAGTGLRQGELFGLGVDAIDREERVVRVLRQVRKVRGRLVFARPKRGKTRDVPLSDAVLHLIDEYRETFPPVSVTLPWGEPGGTPTTVELLVTTPRGNPVGRQHFNERIWRPAVVAAGIPTPGRDDGMHALRHHYASVLLDAGESIRALSEYLGHTDPGFTLKTYTHLMPSSAERTRAAIDGAWTEPSGDHSDGPTTAPVASGDAKPQGE